ncbi:dihydrofolate reductase [Wolbachia endosymbiont of Dirofilaria (Dirofilaria) immitis]|uniref:dihydrofolate reductase n=1 Tax=Wolbachia endosymbiont of Dirofilaria (Dirofilaria) immitis TaxID=1812115 RepID=UPI00158DFEF5|nr:dihydrofolate reductase [Wolbachia endosymbiont of Dirofilaria (Dirofilaria) immitis]QKX02219.1 dihydrofolate reductase [Wolbachia endosymbiont of Dirofilaria (Dirofilaria) immitis]
MIVIGVMAVDPNGVIGVNNRLPWHYLSELEHFRQVTDKQIVVMGRKTFETIPQGVLKDRTPIIFSHNKLSSCFNRNIECTVVSSIEEFLSIQSGSKIYMIGGAQIAYLFLRHNLISEFIITRIHKLYKGDVYFNLMLLNGWNETILTKTQDYTICRVIR